MAKRNEQQRKLELISQLATQRANIAHKRETLTHQIASTKEELKEKINVPKRLKQGIKNKIQTSYRENPKKWFGASIIGGLIVSKIIFRGSGRKRRSSSKQEASTTVSRGILGTAALYVAKPMLKRFVFHKAKLYFASKYLPKLQARFGGQPPEPQAQEMNQYSQYQ